MKACYVLCYYFPQYVRTQTLLDGMREIAELKTYTAINKSTGLWRYIETLLKIIVVRLTRRPDIYILGFRGYEVYWPVRLLTLGKPLIFDHMMSPYDSLLKEKKQVRAGSLLDKLIYLYERAILKNASGVLTDTTNHQLFFADLFNLEKSKFYPVHVSTDEKLFRPCTKTTKNELFQVFFYGSFLPLHGINHILTSASLVRDLPIEFYLVGGHKTNLNHFHDQVKILRLSNITHVPWIPYQQLPTAIANADLCLGGPFGNTGQAQRIITGKTYQFLAMEKPTVVGTISPNPGFIDKQNCLLVPQANEQALAGAIRWAYNHQDALPAIAARGRAFYQENFSIQKVGQNLRHIVYEVLST